VLRVENHVVLGKIQRGRKVTIIVDGEKVEVFEGEMIAAALMASGKKVFRYTKKHGKPRGVYCGIGRCTDCIMTVNGIPNVRTCITPVEDGMVIKTQRGLGEWRSDTGDD